MGNQILISSIIGCPQKIALPSGLLNSIVPTAGTKTDFFVHIFILVERLTCLLT